MIQQQMLDENTKLVNSFFGDDNAVDKIKEAFVTLSEPVVV